ncbi:1-phosphatidylinositol-3-phosphate 5-kinase [Mortierella alpina]|nr:1-phosphatidylinositol-3-phosphate 5-kinase [Mortierella alpina]
MSALTSFDALHEPPSVPDDPPENALSKIFQRVKSTLSTSSSISPSTPSPLPLPDTSTQSPLPLAPSSGHGQASQISSSSANRASIQSTANSSTYQPSLVVSVASSDQKTVRVHEKSSSTSSVSTAGSTFLGMSDSGSWGAGTNNSSGTIHGTSSKGSDNAKPDSSSPNGATTPIVKATSDPDRPLAPRRHFTPTYAPKRASSLFRVSTADQSIVQDDDSASLASLAPPIVSLYPAFGDQQTSKDGAPNEPSGVMASKSPEGRMIDPTRLSAGQLEHSGSPEVKLHVFMKQMTTLTRKDGCDNFLGDISASREYLHYTLGARDPSYDSDARSIRSVSSGHQKGNSLTKVIRRLRGEGVNRDYWMADENAKECFGCSASFFILRRKHHCRICGHIFCSKCASKIIPGAKLGYEGSLRVCNYCLDIMQQYEQSETEPVVYVAGSSWSTPTPAAIHGHFPQQIPMSPSIGSTHNDGTPLDGFRKFLHAGSNLFLARSRSNTATGEQGDGSVTPFRRSLAFEEGGMADSVLDPEIAPFMGEDDDDDQDDFWAPESPNTMGFLTLHGPGQGESSDDDEFTEDGLRDKILQKPARIEERRDMFAKDRSPNNRRISMNGTRPNRNLSLSLMTRGLLRSDGSEPAKSPMDPRPSSPYSAQPPSQGLLHAGRHSRVPSVAVSVVELNNASLQHMRRLLRQLLKRFEIDNADRWDEVIMKLVLKVSNSIQTLGNMDVMQVVKIKKIPGGTAQDTLYINGVVCTKNLAHKQMSRTIQNPRILILQFALEFQRFEHHFMSLEPIVNQEKEFLTHLVGRIMHLSPHIIVVEKTVSRLALELLLKHKVAVAYNVKPEVTEAIAHSTGAHLIASVDKLVKAPRLGTCGKFEVKTFVHELIPNKRKSYMFFQDCPGNLFCSLVLRGGSMETLNRIKKVVQLMVWVSYNLKLETSLMNDQFAMTSAVSEQRLAEEEKIEMSSDPDVSQLQQSLVPYKQTILSASPFVRFKPPFLLTEMIVDAEKLKKIETSTTPTALRDIGNSKILFAASCANAIMTKSSTGRSQDSGFIEGSYIDISNDFQAKSKAWEEFLSSNIGPPLIAPYTYQNLAFLFSNVCTTTRTTCLGPVVRLIQYYTINTDVTLAQYLDQICWDSNFVCTATSCDRPLRDHQRIYAHGDTKIVITVEPWDSLTTVKRDSIMMWSQCRLCDVETPHVYISDDTQNYSFGKFLELVFYQTGLTCRANICPHDINRDHIRYFGLDTQRVKIERVPIRLFDINFPPMLVRCKPEFSARTKNQDLDLVRSLITRYWDSVMERIKNCIFDVVQPSKIEAAKQELLEMNRKVVVERKWILQLLQQTYLNSAPTDTLALNMVRIKLYEKAVMWDKTFGDFAREYFNPDRDFRRITTSKLRRLFDDKEFPAPSDRAHHASLMKDLPMSLDTSDDDGGTTPDDHGDPIPSDLPYLGTSPTLKLARPKIEEADVAALENAIETASSQISFPFMEPKVTRRLSMNLMQEFRPKLTQTMTSDSILTVTDEDLNEKTKSKEPSTAPIIPRIPLPVSSRPTTRVTGRMSMGAPPTYDQQHDRKDLYLLRSGLAAASSPSTSHIHPGNASPSGAKERIIIPLDRTPSTERPSSASSTSSGKNPFFFSKPRVRRTNEMGSSPSTSSHPLSLSASTHQERPHSSGNTSLSSTSVSARKSQYLARAQGGGIPIPSAAHTSTTNSEPHRNVVGNRTRSLTQPMPGPNGNARARFMNSQSNHRHVRQMETKLPAIEVFSSVKEAAKEESDDEEEYQSEGEGDEPYQPSRGYTFSLIQTDAMDEALGTEDMFNMETTFSNMRANTAGGGSSNLLSNTGDDSALLDPVMMMFLGEDDYSSDQQHHHQQHYPGMDNGVFGNAMSSAVGSPPVKSSSVNMTVTGTLSAALAAASKLPQLSEVAEGVERGSLIKTLSNFWQDRNSPNFTPLVYPMQPFEHVFQYSQVIAREDEPSSIVALTLSSPQYVEKLKGIFRGESMDLNNNSDMTAPMSTSGTATPAEESAVAGSIDTLGGNNMASSSASATEGIYDDIQVFDNSLLSERSSHMKFPFLDGSTMLYCKIFYMEQFHALRKAAGCEYSYIQSLARCMKWDATGGKSGSAFLKTRDDRFIMKQLSKVELEAFIKFAPHYFEYMHKAIYHKRPTVLAKIFGFYRVGYKHGALGRSMNMDVLVMENLFYERRNLQVYDLKGSRRNRFVQPSGRENEVLLDENFIEFMSESPFYIREHAKLQLSESLANDSLFLQRFNIMDYSLLVAVSDKQQELLVGIVDFIRPFTWDKKLESWVKDAVGSREPTIVSPAQYRKRFRSAMNRHLDMVPDRWFDIDSFFGASIAHRPIGRHYYYHQQQHQMYANRVGKAREQEWLYHQQWLLEQEQQKSSLQVHHPTPQPYHQHQHHYHHHQQQQQQQQQQHQHQHQNRHARQQSKSSQERPKHHHSRSSSGAQTADESGTIGLGVTMPSRPTSSLILSRMLSSNTE